ncbi:MAG: UDP-N-acetylglucosamine 2-epimerase [Algisphaera sp.]
MPDLRTVAIVTGTRAEYGLLETVMRGVDAHPALTLKVIAAGLHLSTNTLCDIAFPLADRVPMQEAGVTGRIADAASLGRGISGFAQAFATLNPDWVVVLGDRIEAFAAASAAAVGGWHVAHLHGGDRAEGVADESLRHAISKLAHLHLPATVQSAQRLAQMGEDLTRIHTVGSPAVDIIASIAPAHDAPELIVLQHPVGDDNDTEQARMAATLNATAHHRRLVLTPNADPGCEGIHRALRAANIETIDHLPRDRFLALLKGAHAIVGNSSAGLIEAAVCGIPAVNIGPRQGGRETPASVISCGYGLGDVASALTEALSLDTQSLVHPYGEGRTGSSAAQLLATLPWSGVALRKRNSY